MDKTTIVLPTARAIRHEQMQIESSTLFLPTYITMSEFLSKLCIVDGFLMADDDTRVLLLMEASDFSSFKELHIERNFFTFTKNSSYIFKFFEELSAELYEINNLASIDIYGEYEEHIAILQKLYKRYEQLCYEKKILDKIFLPKLYRFNETYARELGYVKIYIEGYLTNFELQLLEQCSEFCRVDIIFNTSSFNKKMQEKLSSYFTQEFHQGYRYRLSLNEKKVVKKTNVELNKNITCEYFAEAVLQIAFIKKKVYEFVKKGYAPEKIAVILPNENIAQLLKLFDDKANFNFAMGNPYTSSEIYKKLDATLKMIDQESCENDARLQRVGDELYLQLRRLNHKEAGSKKGFLELLHELGSFFTNKTELKIFNEEIYKFEKLLAFMQEMSNKAKLSLFMQRLAQRSIDDVRGGKITVMGVLETRMIDFDAVIIVDFDDKNVPKRSEKDMFLNTKLREMASLPTMGDRENLQKHYYEMLMSRSHEVAISYVNSSQNSASRFLKQLGIQTHKQHDDIAYAEILFSKGHKRELHNKEITVEYSFKDKELSATMLKTYLSCKRKYFYKYIQGIKNHTIAKDMPQEYEIGNVVHKALAELYRKKDAYYDVDSLRKDLHKELDKARGESELDIYLIALQKKRLESFYAKEVERFERGFKVLHTEKKLSTPFCGMSLSGIIDRIDKKENAIEVLDYKTGSYELYTQKSVLQASDFQLEFYYLLAGGFGDVQGCFFYDLKDVKLVEELFLKEKIDLLQSHIKDLLMVEEIECTLTENLKHCQFCEYALMCGRT